VRSVKPGSACPSHSWTCFTFLPSANRSDAHVCLKVWKLTQGTGSSFPATSLVSPTAAAAGLSTRPARLGRLSSVPATVAKTGAVSPR
jgi:hypothetical protein